MRTKTKDELLKENGLLQEQLNHAVRADLERRTNLTEILHGYTRQSHYQVFGTSSRRDPMTWLDIAFYMGELRADANYAMLLEARHAGEVTKPT